ncbi:MAG: aldo/keto reductase [bacterium]
MIYREIGTTGMMASAIAFGAWAIGGGAWWGETDDAESVNALHAAIDNGINFIDTAPVYGFGRSEEVVGNAITGKRDKVILATKVGLWWNDERGAFFFTHQDGPTVRRSLRPDTIAIEIEDSLRRLKTDYIDLYQTHWQAIEPEKTAIEDTMASLVKLKDAGKIRAIGVSNCTPDQMDEYKKSGDISANQPRYSMLDRAIEDELVPYCIKNKISILAYSPLEQGLLTGKITMDSTFAKGENRNNLIWMKPVNRQKVINVLESWEDLKNKYNCSTSQLVISWTINQPGITFALCGARKVYQIEDNIKAADIKINEDDIKRMRYDLQTTCIAE